MKNIIVNTKHFNKREMKRILIVFPVLLVLISMISCNNKSNNNKPEVLSSIMKNDNGNLGICFSNYLNEDVIVDYELSFLANNDDSISSRTVINSSVYLKAKEHKNIETPENFDNVFNSDIRIWVTKGKMIIDEITDIDDLENNIFNKFTYKILSDQNNNIAYYVKNKTNDKIIVSLAEITDTINIIDSDMEVVKPINDSITLDPYEEKVFSTSLIYDYENFTKITLGYKIAD